MEGSFSIHANVVLVSLQGFFKLSLKELLQCKHERILVKLGIVSTSGLRAAQMYYSQTSLKANSIQ